MTDGLLDLERYMAVGTCWRRVRVFVVQYVASIMNLYRSTVGASEHYFQRNLEITRDMNLFGSLNRLTNVLESGYNRGIRQNTARTDTLYESQRCDDGC